MQTDSLLPISQLICAALETAINKILSLDDDSKSRLQALDGKSCEVYAIELGFPLLFQFSQQSIVITAPQVESATQAKKMPQARQKDKLSDNECKIKLSVFAIPQLQDMSNLTRLIREEKLDFEGNLNIAQQFGDLFKQLDFDLEEELSKYVGDIAAHTVFSKAKQLHQHAKTKGKLSLDAISDALLDEKPVAVRGIMVENFIQEVDELRSAADRLDARISRLERLTKQQSSQKTPSNGEHD